MATYNSVPLVTGGVRQDTAEEKEKQANGNVATATYSSIPVTQQQQHEEQSRNMETKPAVPVGDYVDEAQVMTATQPMASAIYYSGNTSPAISSTSNAPLDVAKLRSEYVKRSAVGFMFMTVGSLCFSGNMVVPKRLRLVLMFRGTTVDLSQAIFVHPVTTIELVCMFGGAEVLLPPGIRREARGIGMFGGFGTADDNYDAVDLNAPLVVVKGVAMFGGAGIAVKKLASPILCQ